MATLDNNTISVKFVELNRLSNLTMDTIYTLIQTNAVYATVICLS